MMKQDKQRTTSRCAAALVLGLALSARAGAPPGRYTVATDTVLDTKTNLTWQRNAPAALYTRADAWSYCASLNLSGAGWRLPTIRELQSLVDIRARNVAIDTVAFPSTPASVFLSSSLRGPYLSRQWVVEFDSGATTTISHDASSGGHVRCVR